MKYILFGLAVAAFAPGAFAQETNYTVLDGSTSGTRATTASAVARNEPTSASEAAAKHFGQENFEKRWAAEEKMYKDAGISQEKIDKLREMNEKIWKARASGEKIDFKALSDERAKILSKEDMQKFRQLRTKAVQEALGSNAAASTGTRTN